MAHDHSPSEHQHGKLQRAAQPSWIRVPDSTSHKVMEWQQVSLDYAGKQVLSDVNAWVHASELTCICGANGAGKTQLVRMGLGFVQPRVGEVKLLGTSPEKARKRVGYVPQFKSFNRGFPATVEDVLVAAKRGIWPLWSKSSERDHAAAALQRVGGLPLLDKDIAVLSGGELQRVFMARALITGPDLLVLDEPLAAVDTHGRASMIDLLRHLHQEDKLSIILITHSDTVVSALASRVMFLEKGRVIGWGNPEELMNIDELREVAFFGHDHELVIDGGEG